MSDNIQADVWLKADELIEAHGKENTKKHASFIIQGIRDKKR